MKPPSSFKPNLQALKCHLAHLAKERNFETRPEALREVGIYLKKELSSYGYEVRGAPFSFQGKTFSNLVARWPPDIPSDGRLLIGAHFDSVPGSPGADDNASGVACLLEAARIFSETNREDGGRLSFTGIEFVCFNLEEYGMVGSRAYARQLKTEGVKIIGMLSLEMVGYTSQEKGSQKMPLLFKPFYPNVGNFIGLVANTHSKEWLAEVKKIFKSVRGLPVETLILPANGLVFPDARLSDHSPFWDEGYPALLITDTSFYRNPYYHSAQDRVETLDLNFLAQVTEGVIQVALFDGAQEGQGQRERR